MQHTSGVDPVVTRTGLSRWVREPLVIFIVIGALLFVVNAWLNDEPMVAGEHQIVVTEDDLTKMAVALRIEGMGDLTPQQFQNLLDSMIREEVLYREALAMGLDQDDTIVKRRMVQKMDFLAEDLSALREPTTEELQQWLITHPQDFAFPRVTFRHIYYSFDERGAEAQSAAAIALNAAADLTIDAPEAAALGDPFMFQDFYADRTPGQIGLEFGGIFERALFELEPGQWSGPIESGFGWHLVFVDTLVPGRLPEFEEVEHEVSAQWMASQREEFKQVAYEVMRDKYEVILPESVQAGDD